MAFAKLPRLPLSVALVEATRAATTVFQRWWANVCERLEAQEAAQDALIASLADAIASIQAAQDAADAANAAAATAQAAADTAQAAANTVGGQNGLSASHVDPTNILSATDAGADATITIAAHTRVYGDGTSVAVNGGAITGLAYSTSYAVYYDQASRLGGAVSYQTAPDPATASASETNPDRHYVGAVVTPAALGAAVPGIGAVAPNVSLPIGFRLP